MFVLGCLMCFIRLALFDVCDLDLTYAFIQLTLLKSMDAHRISILYVLIVFFSYCRIMIKIFNAEDRKQEDATNSNGKASVQKQSLEASCHHKGLSKFKWPLKSFNFLCTSTCAFWYGLYNLNLFLKLALFTVRIISSYNGICQKYLILMVKLKLLISGGKDDCCIGTHMLLTKTSILLIRKFLEAMANLVVAIVTVVNITEKISCQPIKLQKL